MKGANYDFGLHVQVDVSRGGGSIIAFERMFALGIAEGVETGWLGGYRRLGERRGVKGLISTRETVFYYTFLTEGARSLG